MKLFRPEVIAHRRMVKSDGETVLRVPAIFCVFTITFALSTICAVLILFTYKYTAKRLISGYLVPENGLARLEAQQSGVVLKRFVRENELVRRGQVLFVISNELVTSVGETAAQSIKLQASRSASVSNAIANLQKISSAELAEKGNRLLKMEHELQQLDAELQLQERRIAAAEGVLNKFVSLEQSGFMSGIQTQQKRDEVFDLRSKLLSLERDKSELGSQISALRSDIRLQPLHDGEQRATLERSLAEIDQGINETEARRQVFVTAPIDGRATAIQAEPGAAVSGGQELATIIPNSSRLVVNLFAPSSAIGFVRVGQQVQLRYQAFPYQKFGQYRGTVREISKSTIPNGGSRDGVSAAAFYRIVVVPDTQNVMAYGRREALQADMAVDAAVNLDRRTLIEWIFEPLLALKGKF